MRRGMEVVIEITCMCTEREMFFLEFDSEQAQMTHYLSLVKTNIR